jgi:ketosteroid isomerase-like protein
MTKTVIALFMLIISLATMGGALESYTVKDQLIVADTQFAAATAEKGLEGWLSYFAPDAVIFPAGHDIVAGLQNIRAFYAESGFDPTHLSWKPERAEVAASGDLGYTYGYWEMKRVDKDGMEQTLRGKYMTVWRRQPDGSWKLAADIGTS